ncbi:MAG: exodeoxyribonuclease III [Bacteroidales bacterium]|nr:exodeoxyribonuclease III [Bacteroidales bacterium]MDY0216711.1 exodeoxyribonuclease III [Bacteroidales bacterium]
MKSKLRIATYNVNGIRSSLNKGLADWMLEEDIDILCVQEIKANIEQIPHFFFEEAGYKTYWHSAERKGYSGVAIISKQEPDHVEYGMGMEIYDREGRVIRADFGDLSIISVYHPSGSSGDERLAFKMEWLDDFMSHINELKKERPNLIICGDFNICHQAIDIHDPIRNANVSGFLPEERQWLTDFINSGFSDSFRMLHPEPHQYTWWSYRANARPKNLGWRIDYIMHANHLDSKLIHSVIASDAVHSDHCPVICDYNI